MTSASRSTLYGYALLFSGMATVGVYVALSKPLTASVPVFLLATLRFAIAAVVMLPWLRRRPGEASLNRQVWSTLFIQSFFGNFLFSICMLYGVSMTSASSSGILLSCLPAVVALLSWAWLRERLTPRVWLAVALAIGAVVLLTLYRPLATQAVAVATSPAGAANNSGWGNLLVMACVVCEAIYVILGKRLTGSLSARRNSALLNLIGLALMLPLGIWQGWDFDFDVMTPTLYGLLVFYALAASVVSTWLWLTGLKNVAASHSGVFTVALPIAATSVGVLFLGESLTAVHALALVLAGAGIGLIAFPSGTKTPQKGQN